MRRSNHVELLDLRWQREGYDEYNICLKHFYITSSTFFKNVSINAVHYFSQGIETIVVRYQTMVATVKKKTYDLLDHRKGEVCWLSEIV